MIYQLKSTVEGMPRFWKHSKVVITYSYWYSDVWFDIWTERLEQEK